MPPLKFVVRLGSLVANQTGLQIFFPFRMKPFDDSFQETWRTLSRPCFAIFRVDHVPSFP